MQDAREEHSLKTEKVHSSTSTHTLLQTNTYMHTFTDQKQVVMRVYNNTTSLYGPSRIKFQFDLGFSWPF